MIMAGRASRRRKSDPSKAKFIPDGEGSETSLSPSDIESEGCHILPADDDSTEKSTKPSKPRPCRPITSRSSIMDQANALFPSASPPRSTAPPKPLPSFGFAATTPEDKRHVKATDIIAQANLEERGQYGPYDVKLQHARCFLLDASTYTADEMERVDAIEDFLTEAEMEGEDGTEYDREVWEEVNA